MPKEIKEREEPHTYGVRMGTTLWSGPTNPQFSERAPDGMTVWLNKPPELRDGRLFFYATVESPPDRKGEHVWLCKLPNLPGWI